SRPHAPKAYARSPFCAPTRSRTPSFPCSRSLAFSSPTCLVAQSSPKRSLPYLAWGACSSIRSVREITPSCRLSCCWLASPWLSRTCWWIWSTGSWIRGSGWCDVATNTLAAAEPVHAPKPRLIGFARRVRARPLFLLGIALVSALVLVAVLGPFLVQYSPIEQDTVNPPLAPPSAAHLMGTDYLGRDALSRLLYGAGVSLQVGVASVALASIPGIVLGMIAVYRGGWLDDLINRFLDALMAFPSLVLALAIVAVVGPSLLNVELAIAVASLPHYARLVRGQV